MNNTVKLIIEIPEEVYGYWKTHEDEYGLSKAIGKGISLDDVKTRIEKEIIPRNSDDYDHDVMYQNCGLRMALKIIDDWREDEVSE